MEVEKRVRKRIAKETRAVLRQRLEHALAAYYGDALPPELSGFLDEYTAGTGVSTRCLACRVGVFVASGAALGQLTRVVEQNLVRFEAALDAVGARGVGLAMGASGVAVDAALSGGQMAVEGALDLAVASTGIGAAAVLVTLPVDAALDAGTDAAANLILHITEKGVESVVTRLIDAVVEGLRRQTVEALGEPGRVLAIVDVVCSRIGACATDRLTIVQHGGHAGSYAGDCAIVYANQPDARWCVLIDLGAALPTKTTAPLARAEARLRDEFGKQWWKDKAIDRAILVTHFHEDHAGARKKYVLRALARRWNGPLWHSRHAADLGDDALPETRAWIGDDKLFRNRCRLARSRASGDQSCDVLDRPLGSLRARLTPLVPAVVENATSGEGLDQNDCSLGALLRLTDADGGHVFSFLTLGDMTRASGACVTELAGEDGRFPPIDLVKYPHHGSSGNYLDCFDALLAHQCPDVLISGHTGTEVRSVVERLLGTGAASVSFLIGTEQAAEQLLSLSVWGRLSETYGERLRALHDARIEISTDGATVTSEAWHYGGFPIRRLHRSAVGFALGEHVTARAAKRARVETGGA